MCLSKDAAKILIQVFINTRLDYCISLYFGIADGLMSRLQSDQNAACMSHHRSPAVRAHRASLMAVALAASPQTSGFQDIHPQTRILCFTHLHTVDTKKNKLMSLRKVKVR